MHCSTESDPCPGYHPFRRYERPSAERRTADSVLDAAEFALGGIVLCGRR